MSTLQPYWQRSAEGIPLLGSWALSVGKLWALSGVACDVSPWIVVQAGFYETPQLLWSLFKPDAVDEAWNRTGPVQPKPHRRNRRGGRGPMFRFRGATPIIGERLGSGGGVPLWVFPLGDLAQKAGWYFILVDATLDYLVRWQSTAYEWTGCFEAEYWGRATDIYAPPFGYQGTNQSTAWYLSDSAVWPVSSLGINLTVPPLYQPAIQLDAVVRGAGPTWPSFECKLEIVRANDNFVMAEVTAAVPANGEAPAKTFAADDDKPYSRSYFIRLSTDYRCEFVPGSTWGVTSNPFEPTINYDPP